MKIEDVGFGAVIVLVILFVGLFALNIVNNLTNDSDKYDYTYTTLSNSSEFGMNSTENATFRYTFGAIQATISGESAPTKSLIATIRNQNSTGDFNTSVFLNGALLGTSVFQNGTEVNYTFNNVGFTANAVNNITFSTDAEGPTDVC